MPNEPSGDGVTVAQSGPDLAATQPVGGRSIGRVMFWMAGALTAFSVMAVSIRGLASTLNVFETLSIRSIVGVIVMFTIAATRPRMRAMLSLDRIGLHAARNIVHFAGQAAWATGVTLLPLATVFAIEFTSPLWVALLAFLFLGERLTANRIGATLLGFVGVLCILRPGVQSFQPATLLVLAGTIGFSITYLLTKKLTVTDTTYSILFWMNLVQLPLNLAFSDPWFPLRLGYEQILPAIGISLAGLASHFCLTNAFRWGDAMIVVPLDFLRLPIITVVGVIFYAEPVDGFVAIGALLVFAGVLWNLRAEAKRN